jgi:hypothetical protein
LKMRLEDVRTFMDGADLTRSQTGISPNIVTLDILITAAKRGNSVEIMDKVLQDIEKLGLKPGARMYAVILEFHIAHVHPPRCHFNTKSNKLLLSRIR